jgi:hypothetical protein
MGHFCEDGQDEATVLIVEDDGPTRAATRGEVIDGAGVVDALIPAAMHGSRCDPVPAPVATKAVAHKLARAAYHIMCTHQPFEEARAFA